MDVSQLVNQIYPAAAFAREQIEIPGRADQACAALDAAAVLLRLHQPPHHVYYQPDRLFADRHAALEDARHSLYVEPVKECAGDPEAVFACARVLMQSAELQDDAVLVAELLDGQDPVMALHVDGAGQFPEDVSVDGFFRLSREEAGACWTLATRGGRIDAAPSGLMLRLGGMRVIPEPVQGLDAAVTQLNDAAAALRGGATDAARTRLDALLAELGQESAMPAPADPGRILDEVCVAHRELLDRKGIMVERVVPPGLPALSVRRAVIALALTAAIEHSVAALTRGGRVVLSVDVDAAGAEAAVQWQILGQLDAAGDDYRLAALRRAASLHGGLFDTETCAQSRTLTLLLPDEAGRMVQAWIPGAYRFGERSQQMLRLVASQPGAVPREIVLAGVLEDELARWLGPCLDTPLAANVAREAEQTARPFASGEAQKKALGRVAKGKPQKDLTQPKYAAELLWAFRASGRGRTALGVEGLPENDVERLCGALTDPARYEEALRLIASVIEASAG